MAQLVVRDLDDGVKAALKRRAARRGRSLEAEVRDILAKAAREKDAPRTGLGTALRRRFAGKGLDREIAELRGQIARPAAFRK